MWQLAQHRARADACVYLAGIVLVCGIATSVVLGLLHGGVSILALGSLLAVLSASLIRSLSTAQRRAVQMAEAMTEQLRRSESRFRNVTAASPVGIFQLDAEGRLVFANDRLSVLAGRTSTELVDGGLTTAVHPDERDGVARALAQASAGATTYHAELRLARPDGSVAHVSCSAQPLAGGGLCGTLEDVTARHQATQALRASEERFRRLIEHSPDGVAVVREGVLAFVNPAFVASLGHQDEAALIGRRISEIVDRKDDATTSRIVRDGLDATHAGKPVERLLRRRDGSFITVELIAIAVELDGGPAVLVVTRDVTARKEMQAKLIQSDRLACVGTLAAGVAHELNNPLAYVVANLALIGEELAGAGAELGAGRAGRLEAALADAREGTERVRRTVRDLKLFARPEEERARPTDVHRIIDTALAVAACEIRHRARLVKQLGDVPPVLASEARLGQVLVSLIVNAAQAMREGDATRNELRITTRRHGPDRVAILVEDTGVGMSREVLDRIFDPFFTTRPVGAGSGLGLSICRSIVASLGGEISARSTPGRGSTFAVVLPADREPARPEEPGAQDGDAPPQRARVLVIDDEAALARSLARTLGGEHDVTVVTSGRDGLQLLRQRDFDVVLCDLMMPDMTGMEVHAELARTHPGVEERMIFMTGGAFTTRARGFLDQVDNPRIEKPFDLPAVRALVRAHARAV